MTKQQSSEFSLTWLNRHSPHSAKITADIEAGRAVVAHFLGIPIEPVRLECRAWTSKYAEKLGCNFQQPNTPSEWFRAPFSREFADHHAKLLLMMTGPVMQVMFLERFTPLLGVGIKPQFWSKCLKATRKSGRGYQSLIMEPAEVDLTKSEYDKPDTGRLLDWIAVRLRGLLNCTDVQRAIFDLATFLSEFERSDSMEISSAELERIIEEALTAVVVERISLQPHNIACLPKTASGIQAIIAPGVIAKSRAVPNGLDACFSREF